jgi:CheY-like chemotaxis protein
LSKHVLIIDDNKMGTEILAEILNAMGITASALHNSASFESIRANAADYAAVFVDLEMPKIDGFEMLRILKSDLGMTAPIIAYSVHTSEIAEAREGGFDGFLGKPLDLDHVADYITRIMGGEEVWAVN